MTFPWIRERLQQGSLMLHGWYFDISIGQLYSYSPESTSFVQLG
jgi:carbonic anhydrase